MTERWTISLPDDLAERVEDHLGLGHGDNRSAFVQAAIREKLERETNQERAGNAAAHESATVSEPGPAETSPTRPEAKTSPAQEPASDRDQDDAGREPPDADLTPAEREAIDEIVADATASWDDTPDRLEQRRAAARAALAICVAEGSLGRSEAMDDHALFDRYPVDGQNERTWWRKNVRPALQAAGDYSNAKHGYVVDLDHATEDE